MRLQRPPGRFAIVRLAADAVVPDWALRGAFFSVTRTAGELSIVCEQRQVPAGVRQEPGWAALEVEGPIAFSETGVLAALASPLAAVGVPLFAVSTFDTDYLLVPERDAEAAVRALEAAGHTVL